MDDYTKIQCRSFFFSFSAAFFILSLTFLFLVTTARPAIPDSLTGEPEINDGASAYVPKKEDGLTVLFIGDQPEGSGGAGIFMLVRFDPVSGKIPVIVLPPETAVLNSGKVETISDVYRYGGAKYLKNALSETVGIPVDRYVKMNADSFITAANLIGFVEFDLPVQVTVTRSGAPVTLNPGKQLLDGQKAADIISCRSYPGGEDQRLFIVGELAAAAMNQRMDVCLSTVVDNVFEKLINLISTDISYADYHARKPAAEFLAKLGSNPAYRLEASGRWHDGRSLFILRDTFTAQLSQTMR